MNRWNLKSPWLSATENFVQILFTCALIFGAGPTHADYNPGLELYFQDIPIGAVVEGSTRYGGIQPDYAIDAGLEEFLRIGDAIGAMPITPLEKVELVIKEVRAVFEKHHRYNDPVYLEILREHREAGTNVPLSKYISCGAGVCRENALVLHLTLKRAGIPNHHVYAKVLVRYGQTADVPENHGFVVFQHEGERWIADSYFRQFNGYSFDEFMQNQGVAIGPRRRLPFAEHRAELRTITKLNAYPAITIPSAASCKAAFLNQ